MEAKSSPSGPVIHDFEWSGYPGGKGASGVAHRIIGQMPPHRTYIEGFLGHGGILRAKKMAEWNLGIDANPRVIAKWVDAGPRFGYSFALGDALEILPSFAPVQDPGTLVYLDPPYLLCTRTRLLYDHEFATEEEHTRLLAEITKWPCMVMISGYWAPLYDSFLRSWRALSYQTMTRGGAREEWLWCNFPEPTVLHDVRYGGRDFRDRERAKRKRARWSARFRGMGPWERQIIREALSEVDRDVPTAAANVARPQPHPE